MYLIEFIFASIVIVSLWLISIFDKRPNRIFTCIGWTYALIFWFVIWFK